MSAWEEYLALAQRLDTVRRRAARTAAEQDDTLRAVHEELAGVRQRLSQQQTRFTEVANARGVRLPPLIPSDSDVRMALAPGSSPAAVGAALRHARLTMDEADEELAAVRRSRWPRLAERGPAVRNLVVYAAFALAVLVLQVLLFVVASEQALLFLVPICGLVLPLLAFALGWLTVGIVYPPIDSKAGVDRTPFVGAVVCLVAPVLLTCTGFGMFTLFR